MDSNASPPSALTLMIQSRHDRMIADDLDGLRRLGGFNALRVEDYFAEWTFLFQKLFLYEWTLMNSNASPPSALTLIIQSRHDRMIAENLDGLRRLGGFNALRLGNYFVMWTLYLRSFFS